ncbi:hypothetical protein [Chitinophaga qingshengii]|uniref:Uncharacterized protein n=1 Tax=Chitinophaga qingshengii TaxID=1569794 RepID=A0ABR7TTI9_9BACT|nr:hypothetical protein [Chitinophaga qingshengii]MBC9932771.1 hypothetical protein [Chitinophaga qingshengii]
MEREQYDLFTSLVDVYSQAMKEVNTEALFRERNTLERVTGMMAWNLLPYDQRRNRRWQLLQILMKGGDEEGRFKFNHLFCQWDDKVTAAIQLLESLMPDEQDPVEKGLLFRLHAMFLTEQYLLNINKDPERSLHNDYYVMMGAMDDFYQSKHAMQVGVADLQSHFTEMYRNWEKRPYRDV